MRYPSEYDEDGLYVVHAQIDLDFLARFECRQAKIRAAGTSEGISEEATSTTAGSLGCSKQSRKHPLFFRLLDFDSLTINLAVQKYDPTLFGLLLF